MLTAGQSSLELVALGGHRPGGEGERIGFCLLGRRERFLFFDLEDARGEQGGDGDGFVGEHADARRQRHLAHQHAGAELGQVRYVDLELGRHLHRQRFERQELKRLHERAAERGAGGLADEHDPRLAVDQPGQVDLVEVDVQQVVGHGVALDLAEDDRERVRAAVDLHLDDRVAVNRTEDALQLKDGGLERDGGLTAGVDVAGQDALDGAVA